MAGDPGPLPASELVFEHVPEPRWTEYEVRPPGIIGTAGGSAEVLTDGEILAGLQQPKNQLVWSETVRENPWYEFARHSWGSHLRAFFKLVTVHPTTTFSQDFVAHLKRGNYFPEDFPDHTSRFPRAEKSPISLRAEFSVLMRLWREHVGKVEFSVSVLANKNQQSNEVKRRGQRKKEEAAPGDKSKNDWFHTTPVVLWRVARWRPDAGSVSGTSSTLAGASSTLAGGTLAPGTLAGGTLAGGTLADAYGMGAGSSSGRGGRGGAGSSSGTSSTKTSWTSPVLPGSGRRVSMNAVLCSLGDEGRGRGGRK